jgi:ribosomal protein S8
MIHLPSNPLSRAWKGSAVRVCVNNAKPAEFRRVKNGLGVAIISTSKGVMTDKDAKAQNVGGEVLCYVY